LPALAVAAVMMTVEPAGCFTTHDMRARSCTGKTATAEDQLPGGVGPAVEVPDLFLAFTATSVPPSASSM
jgi:hypothetical protein